MSVYDMTQISARLPDDLIASVDAAAHQLRRTRADVIRQAIEYYLEDFDDLSKAVDALKDPSDSVIDWKTARRDLLGLD
jgi:RHH-type rel operon transcriptional repressor/antitoxin RelB